MQCSRHYYSHKWKTNYFGYPICSSKVVVANSPDPRFVTSPSQVTLPICRIARSWTQTKPKKQPSSFWRYLWSSEWPLFTLEAAVEKLWRPTSLLILPICCQQLLTHQQTALSSRYCGLISCASGTTISYVGIFVWTPSRAVEHAPFKLHGVCFCFPIDSSSPLLWSSSGLICRFLPGFLLFFSNTCVLFCYVLLVSDKWLGFGFSQTYRHISSHK